MKRRKPGRPLVLGVIAATLTTALSGSIITDTAARASSSSVTNSSSCPADYEWDGLSNGGTPGVVLCGGDNGFGNLAVVDLHAGAKLRVVSDWVDGSGHLADAQFRRKDIEDWDDFILNNEGPLIPAPDRLVAYVNAGFFVDTSSATTPLSLPEIRTEGQVTSMGYALGHHDDAAWSVAPKMGLMLGNPSSPGAQEALIAGWGDPVTGAYTESDVNYLGSQYYDVATGFPGWTAPGDATVPRPRTFVFDEWRSSDGHHIVYILKTGDKTLAEVNDEITRILGYRTAALQLDGGRSSAFCWTGPNYPYCSYDAFFGRDVPQILAVYSAPVQP